MTRNGLVSGRLISNRSRNADFHPKHIDDTRNRRIPIHLGCMRLNTFIDDAVVADPVTNGV